MEECCQDGFSCGSELTTRVLLWLSGSCHVHIGSKDIRQSRGYRVKVANLDFVLRAGK